MNENRRSAATTRGAEPARASRVARTGSRGTAVLSFFEFQFDTSHLRALHRSVILLKYVSNECFEKAILGWSQALTALWQASAIHRTG